MVRWLRHVTRFSVLLLALWTGFSAAAGIARGSVESFCPMGALAALPPLLSSGRMICSVGEAALAALVALGLLTLLARKSFCSWLCPVGTVLESLGRLGARMRRRGKGRLQRYGMHRPAAGVDRAGRLLRIGVLTAVVAGTVATAELVFRPFCPYYLMTSFHGHDTRIWSYGVLLLVLVTALVLPLAWCRYLCPLGAAMWPLSRAGFLSIDRKASICTDCGMCDRACPHGLRPSATDRVVSGECTLCLECTSACPVPGALVLRARPAGRKRLPAWTVPALVCGLSLAAFVGSDLFRIPTYTWKSDDRPAVISRILLEVDGVRCAHTARLAAGQLLDLDGVTGVTAYASKHLLEIEYIPDRVGPEVIKKALEAPVVDGRTGLIRFGVFKVRNAKE